LHAHRPILTLLRRLMSGGVMETTKKPPERFLRSGSLHPAILGCPADSVPVANRAIVIMTLGTMTFKC
jgi:hypothetical protein